MSISEIAAWWGAIIATTVLIWDIIKWHNSKPRIEVSADRFLHKLGGQYIPDNDPGKWSRVWIKNTGGSTTTIEKIGFEYKGSLGEVPSNNERDPLPKLLEPGESYPVFIVRHSLSEEELDSGKLYYILYASHKKRPIRKVVKYGV